MRYFGQVALITSATILLSSCSNESGTKQIKVEQAADKLPAGEIPKQDTFNFARPAPGSDSVKAFLADPTFSWQFSDTQLTLNRANGTTILYDRARAAWSAVETWSDSASYDTVYAYQDGSFVGLKPATLNIRVGAGRLLSYDMSQILPAGSKVLGVGPGFFAAAVADGIMVLRGANNTASSIKIKGSPEELVELAPCVSGCVLWGHDGSSIHTYGEDSVWTKHSFPFAAPEGKKLARLALNLKVDTKGLLTVDHAALLSQEGELFLSRFQGAGDRVVTFEEVKPLTTRYCVSCHSADAFDQETGLKAFKSKIVTRLTLDSTSPQVMPPKSAPKVMSTADKAVVVAWLKLQTEGVDKEPSGGGSTAPGPEDKSKLVMTGVLATQGEKYCQSCHPTAKFQAFWYDKQSDISSRVTSGNMPAGKSMTDADKAALLKAVDELN